MAKSWVSKLRLKKGALRATAKRAGAIGRDGKISLNWLRQKAKGNDLTAKRARLALAFRKMRH